MYFVIVDNNKSDLELLAQTIVAAVPECQVQSFVDPLLSAKYICNNPVDVVLVADAMRPVNGFRLLQVLRKNIPQLAVVILSGDEQNRTDAFQAGATDYLIKPVSADSLGGMIKQLASLDKGELKP